MTMTLMPDEDPMSRSGARWCDAHRKWECSKHSRRSEDGNCHQWAITGTATCRLHSGRTLAAAKAIGAANMLVWSTQAAGDAPGLDPGRVVMDQLRVAVLRADLFGELVRLQMIEDPSGGIVGVTRAAGHDGGAVETGEQVRGLVKLEAEWRDRAVRFAKTAHDMGIAEREIEMAEVDAQRTINGFIESVTVLDELLDSRDLIAEIRDRMVRRFLQALDRELGLPPDGELEQGGDR